MDKKLIFNKLNHFAKSVTVVISSAILMMGCSQSFYNPTTYQTDDLYATHNRDKIIEQQHLLEQARIELEQQRRAYWAEELGLDDQVMAVAQSEAKYNTPYGEKLAAISASTEYKRPSSYYTLQYDKTLDELAQYDPAEYDAYIDEGGNVVIEPKYVSSMYGTWGDPYYNHYAWTYGYPSWRYYSAWGYPRYTWWDYNYSFGYGWSFGFSPFYSSWWGVSPYFGWYNWYRPYTPRPPYIGGGGGGVRPSTSIVRRPNIQSSPSSSVGKRNTNGSTVGRSSGNTYNRGGTTRSTSPSYTSPTRTQSFSSPSRGTSGGSSGGANRIGR